MQFLRTLFWVVLAVVAAIFAFRNWTTVTVNLWGGIAADIKLPVLVFAAFLLGLLPGLALLFATRWRYRRRLATETRAAVAPQPLAIEPAPAAAPVAVPPTLS